jgi:hypothetical protein
MDIGGDCWVRAAQAPLGVAVHVPPWPSAVGDRHVGGVSTTHSLRPDYGNKVQAAKSLIFGQARAVACPAVLPSGRVGTAS